MGKAPAAGAPASGTMASGTPAPGTPASGALAERLLANLLADAAAAPCRLSVVGICKNAGKTVALNHLVQAAARRGIWLGLVSTGRDGESQDAITELPKPRIWAPAGALVATAKAALAVASARTEVLQELPWATPFGPLCIGRVTASGEVLLIGPGSAGRLAEVLGALEAHGAWLSLVDGSFDRIAASAPAVTGRMLLAAGAAYSPSMNETVAQVRHLLDLFDAPTVPPDLTEPVSQAIRQGPVSIVAAQGAVTAVPVASGLGDPAPIVAAAAQALAAPTPAAPTPTPAPAIVLAGALSDRLLAALLGSRLFLPVVVNDPTRILVDRNLWRRWRRQGGRAYVRQSARLIALTANAHSPVGRDYSAADFHAALSAVTDRPVYDLVAGLP